MPRSTTWLTKGSKELISCTSNHDSYDSELGFRSFVFILLEDEQEPGVGYLLDTYIASFKALIYLFFGSFNNVIFWIFTSFV